MSSQQPSYAVRLDKKLLDQIREIAKREGRTLRGQIEWVLKLAARKEKP